MRGRLPGPPLLVITDRRQAARPLAAVLEAAFTGGCRWASLREKDLPADQQVALARDLHGLAQRFGALFTLHGDPATARAAGVDGVHLAAGSDATAARALLGPAALIGISIHSAGEVSRLDPAMVDYAVIGPFNETASKPGYGPALGPGGVRAIAAAAPVPLIAIGGIAMDSIEGLSAAGAAGIAVMGGVMRALEPAAEICALIAAWEHWHDRTATAAVTGSSVG